MQGVDRRWFHGRRLFRSATKVLETGHLSCFSLLRPRLWVQIPAAWFLRGSGIGPGSGGGSKYFTMVVLVGSGMTGFDRKHHPKMKPRSYKTVNMPLAPPCRWLVWVAWPSRTDRGGEDRLWRLSGKDGRLQRGLRKGSGSGCGEELLKTPGNGLKAEVLLGSSNSSFSW